MNLASALLKQVIASKDFETWSCTRKHYLPTEFHQVYSVIDQHCSKFHTLPSFDDLKYSVRDSATLDKLSILESVEVEVEASRLLEYLKGEYTQREIFRELEGYIENSIAFEDAEESLEHLHEIIMEIEKRVEIKHATESMGRMALFAPDEELNKYIALGLNEDYDSSITFSPTDLLLFGGKRGAGKSITSANIANNIYQGAQKSAIYFTIEMDARSTMQRLCSIGANVPFARLRNKNLSSAEWNRVAGWWAERFTGGVDVLRDYAIHHDFSKFHNTLISECHLVPDRQLDVIYDPELSISAIQVELDKKVRSMNVGVVIVDYINQVRRSSRPVKSGQYDWTEQIEVSKALKLMAQEYEVPIISPYQIDSSGEARFAKGILDAADGAFTIDPYSPEDQAMGFNCTKMRSAPLDSFISKMDWNTLKIGPETMKDPTNKEEEGFNTGESIEDV